jgi:hypothetical protein
MTEQIAAAADLAKFVSMVWCKRAGDQPGDLARSRWLFPVPASPMGALWKEPSTQASDRSSPMILSNPQRWPLLDRGVEDPVATHSLKRCYALFSEPLDS